MERFSRKELWVTIACLAIAALWIDFSGIHRFHGADSIVMVLVSIYQWTPLYWEQDRLGMLFPLLATPWQHPLDNLLAQGAMTIFSVLSSGFLFGYYVAGRGRGLAIGALSGMLLIGFLTLDQRFAYFINIHQFGTSSAIGLLGLILLDRWAQSRSLLTAWVGCTCIFVAHWINPGVAFALGPLLAVRGLCFRGLGSYLDELDDALLGNAEKSQVNSSPWARRVRPSQDEVLAIVAIGLSLAGTMVLSRTVAEPLPYHFLSLDEWFASAREMWNSNEHFHRRWFAAVEIAGAIGAATLIFPAGRKVARLSIGLAAGLLAVALVQFAFMSSLDHVRDNHSSRYITTAVFFWQGALLSFAVLQVGAVLKVTRGSRRLPLAMTVAMVVLAASLHGRPSIATVRAALDEKTGRFTDEIVGFGCTHVSGTYWHVWPAMFHANLKLADAHSSRRVWGIAQRSLPTEKYWRRVPWTQMRIAEILGDEPQSLQSRDHYGLPPAIVECELATIRVLRPTSPWDDRLRVANRSARQN